MSKSNEILKAAKGQESKIEIYWDRQDLANEGPAYRYRDGSESGPLEFVRWSESESESVEGYEMWMYFGSGDRYSGPDQHGVYPIFEARVGIETSTEEIYLVDVVWGAREPNDAWFDEDENLLSEEAAVEKLKNQISDDEEGYVFVVYVYGNEIESGWIVENGKLVRIVNWDLIEYRVNQ